MIENKAWNIISPYDISDLTHSFEVRMKDKRHRSSVIDLKRSVSPNPERARKSLPKAIKNDSHVLTPTKSSLLKAKDHKKSLVKSKSSTSLLSKKEKTLFNEKVNNFNKVQLENAQEAKENFINFESDLEQIVVKKTSNPKNLAIDTENIENEYTSPIHYNPLPIEIIRLDTLNFYSSAFTLKEAISSDLLTGKIYPSQKTIEKKMLIALVPHKKKNFPNKIENSFFEVVMPDEFQQEKKNFSLENNWKKFSNSYLEKIRHTQKRLVSLFLTNKSRIHKKKVNKSNFQRRPRSLAEVSMKIGKIIESYLLKSSKNLQDLIESAPDTPKLMLNYSPQYCQSQEFFVDLFFCLWDYKQKPLSCQSLSIYLEPDRMISELPRLKDPSLRFQHILTFIPLLIITWRHVEAQDYIDQCLKLVPGSKPTLIWQALLEILEKTNTSAIFYKLSEFSAPPNLSFQYKIAQVYSFYYSCLFRSTSRTVAYLKSLNLADWENLVIADIYIKSNDKSYEEIGLEILNKLSEANNVYINFLACFKLVKVLKEYNQYSKALEVIRKSRRFVYPEHLNLIFEVLTMKINAYMNLEIQINSEVPLLKYQYARLSLKYNLKSPLDKVYRCLNSACAYSQLYSISNCQFPVNFWKFILLRKLGIHKLAAKQGILALDYESNDKVKHLAINEYVKSIENAGNVMQMIFTYLLKKDLPALTKLYDPVCAFDEYLGICMRSILTKTIENKEKIPVHKFEGYFSIWTCLYSNFKHKDKQFKPLEGQEEIDKRDKKHPLHILFVSFT